MIVLYTVKISLGIKHWGILLCSYGFLSVDLFTFILYTLRNHLRNYFHKHDSVLDSPSSQHY